MEVVDEDAEAGDGHHGDYSQETETLECGNCGTAVTTDMKACPNCGAQLVFEEE